MTAYMTQKQSHKPTRLTNVTLMTPSQYRSALNSMDKNKCSTHEVIWDSGASVCITPDKKDFLEYTPTSNIKEVKTMGGKASQVVGEGLILWSMHDSRGQLRHLKLKAYHIPSATTRLLSTSSLLQTYEDEIISVNGVALMLSGMPNDSTRNPIIAYYNPVTNLPTTTIYNYQDIHKPAELLANTASVVDDHNRNLSQAEKELLKWHYRLGHLSFRKIQHLMKTGVLSNTESSRTLHTAASKIRYPPKCAACLFGKQTTRPAPGKTTTIVQDRAGVLRAGNLFPGTEVSVDHFISSIRGRLFSGYNKGSEEQRYCGGCIFVDHSSGYIHIEFQNSLSSHETLRAKLSFEKICRDFGVVVKTYMSDNGTAFTSKDFTNHLSQYHQISKLAGVGAHHHNAQAERSIRTIMTIARTMMMHAGIHWPEVAQASLWPMAVSHACYLWNHVPDPTNGLSPHDLFTRTRWPHRRFHDMHVWGCPVYVLNSAIRDGKKIPKWQPRSDKTIYMGTSPSHASTVPLVLNITTGSLTAQFHVVFDDWFATVSSSSEQQPDFTSKEWLKMFGDSTFQYLTDEDNDNDDDKSDHHQLLKLLQQQEDIDLQQSIRNPPIPLPVEEQPSQSFRKGNINDLQPKEHTNWPSTSNKAYPEPSSTSIKSPSPPRSSPVLDQIEEVPPLMDLSTQRKSTPRHSRSPTTPVSSPRRSKQSSKPITRLTYTHDKSTLTGKSSNLASNYHSSDSTLDSYYINLFDHVYAFSAKSKTDPDLFSFDEAMSSEHFEQWVEAAKGEIKQLEDIDCWAEIPMTKATTKVIPGTWVFKIKRAPDGTLKKFKARYCIRGDLQEGEFDTYAPVVQLSSVRLFLAWSLILSWQTCCIDFSNAFAQATLEEDIYVHIPRGFRGSLRTKSCLKLKKSLYGLSVAPRLWFKHLWKALEAEGFIQSAHDPCLLFRHDMIIVQYVDDLGIAYKDMTAVDKLISKLEGKGFGLTKEGSFTEYLGINYTHNKDGSILMNQPGLVDKIITASGMENCNPNRTPCTREALALDPEGKPMTDKWNYRSIVGMLLYLATNTRPDIAYAVSQVARFSHSPKQSHATAVKTIVRYLSGTREKGSIFNPPKELTLDCYVDADFAGLYGRDPDSEPTAAKSRTGYIISMAGCYIQCKSQLQSTIALSTSEAEYCALSQAMRTLIPIREIILEFIEHVKLVDVNDKYIFNTPEQAKEFTTTIYEDNSTALNLATNQKITSRTKHWCIKWHFFWEHLNDESKNMKCIKVSSEEQRADYLTKGLTRDTFENCRKLNQGW